MPRSLRRRRTASVDFGGEPMGRRGSSSSSSRRRSHSSKRGSGNGNGGSAQMQACTLKKLKRTATRRNK